MNTNIQKSDVQAYERGERELKDVLGLTPEYIEALRGRTQFFLDGGHWERAVIMLEMLEELDRRDVLPTVLAAHALVQLGRSDLAQAKLEERLAKRPNEPEVLVALAEVKIAIGALAPAAELLGRVIEADPRGTSAACRRAQAVAAEAHARFEVR